MKPVMFNKHRQNEAFTSIRCPTCICRDSQLKVDVSGVSDAVPQAANGDATNMMRPESLCSMPGSTALATCRLP